MQQVRNPKPFTIDGEAVDQEVIIRIRSQLEDQIEDQMRAKGYVPYMDITPELYWEYKQESETFDYTVRMFGIYVGTKNAKKMMGILGNRPIMFEGK